MARVQRTKRRRTAADVPVTSFGEFFAHQRRTRTQVSLREFCQAHGFDAGNLSKLERGRLAVPQSREVLERYAHALGIQDGSNDWYEFFDLAAAEAGRIPEDLLSDTEVAKKLPVLFRALRDEQSSDEEKLRDLIEIIRRT